MFVDKTFPIPAGCLDFRFLCRYEKELQPWLLIGVTLLVVVRAGGRVGADQDNLITDKTHLHVTQTRHVTKSIFNLRVRLVTGHTCARDSLIESWLWSSMKCSVFNIAYPTVDFTLFLNNLVMLQSPPFDCLCDATEIQREMGHKARINIPGPVTSAARAQAAEIVTPKHSFELNFKT